MSNGLRFRQLHTRTLLSTRTRKQKIGAATSMLFLSLHRFFFFFFTAEETVAHPNSLLRRPFLLVSFFSYIHCSSPDSATISDLSGNPPLFLFLHFLFLFIPCCRFPARCATASRTMFHQRHQVPVSHVGRHIFSPVSILRPSIYFLFVHSHWD